MFISENGLNLIKEFEGCILSAYDDFNDRIVSDWSQVRGTITIGWGITPDDGINICPGMTISQQEADDMFRNSMGKYCDCVNNAMSDGTISFSVNQNMFDALTSFCYNCGQGSLRTLCRNRDKQTVADMMLEYRNKGSQWEQGLLRRRQAERELFLSDGEGGVVIPCNGGSSDPTSKAREFVGDRALELQQKLNRAFGYGLAEDGIIGQASYSAILDAQGKLGVSQDGLFGEQSFGALENYLNGQQQQASQPQGDGRILELQRDVINPVFGVNIDCDGLWGNITDGYARQLTPASLPNHTPELTRWVQIRLGCQIDSIYGQECYNAVIGWQSSHNLECDGVVGYNTIRSLCGL